MNVNSAGKDDIQLANRDSSATKGHYHEEEDVLVEDGEDCPIASDTRTVWMDQGASQTKNEIYKHNGIRTSKYTAITFLPLNLLT